jgi:hypothetical protein
MTPSELLKWQWDGYFRYHQSRANLAIHVFAIPVFLIGNVVAVVSLLSLDLGGAVLGVVLTGASMFIQGRSHKLEPVPSEPFASVGQFFGRFFLEQWINFPRFVLSGGWVRNWKAADHPVT